LEVLQTMRAEFPNDPSAELRATIAESEIYQSMGDTEQAEEAFNKALSISKQYDQILDKEIKLEMSKTCYQICVWNTYLVQLRLCRRFPRFLNHPFYWQSLLIYVVLK
jgi:tetratricopeptide (TPR) repeat protein